jgi:hypothetical protein
MANTPLQNLNLSMLDAYVDFFLCFPRVDLLALSSPQVVRDGRGTTQSKCFTIFDNDGATETASTNQQVCTKQQQESVSDSLNIPSLVFDHRETTLVGGSENCFFPKEDKRGLEVVSSHALVFNRADTQNSLGTISILVNPSPPSEITGDTIVCGREVRTDVQRPTFATTSSV